MKDIHQKNIAYLSHLLGSKSIRGMKLRPDFTISYFKSGAGTHLYLIKSGQKKYVARINFYPKKNSWGVKKQEYRILKKIQPLHIAPKVYYVSTRNPLGQHFTIVDYVEGKPLKRLTDNHVVYLARTLKKLHSIRFKRAGDTFPPKDALPYTCDIFMQYANGDDKQIEEYKNLPGIDTVIEPYNRIKNKLGKYFNHLRCFDGINKFCLVHADLKMENMVAVGNKIFLIDWECGGSDIPETDIGNLFADCRLSKKQQQLFLQSYYGKTADTLTLERIYAVKKVLDFFRIIDDYILNKRKRWNAKRMREELLEFEKNV